ncbi:MAG: N-acetylmuramoyl-L-alanine amidase CwlD [Firmicutes bacterium]|nr:N-acetylmuramoyl-L-alanine amidase CwlD [Bacillota bacterium]
MRAWFFSGRQVAWWVFSCLALGLFLGTTGSRVLPVSTERLYQGISGRTIVIDAGHGGIDPGAVSAKGILEKDITLQIAKKLETLLKRAAVYVVMVRHGDHDLADSSELNLLNRKRQDLARRVYIAEEAQADLYLSIHANFFPSPIWSGAQTFYYEEDSESAQLARDIQAELVRQLGPNNRVAKTGDYRVLRDPSMPAVLVEVGFLSNPSEADLLAQPDYQQRIANAIFAGLCLYYGNSY